MTLPILALTALLAADAKNASALDACTALLPPTLQDKIISAYPGSRPVQVSDYSAERVERERQHHGDSPCLGVASADVDGDGRTDFALLILGENRHTIVLAARPGPGTKWRIDKLTDLGDGGPGHSYVNVVESGSYADLGLNDKKEPGQVARYKSAHPGFIAGTIESSGVAYFYTGKRWVHLWLSD